MLEICSTVLTIFNKILDSTSQNVHHFTNFLVTAYIVPPSHLFYTDIRLQENYLFSLRRITQNGKFIIRGNPEVYSNGFQAVKDFNLEIADKEFIIFVGPSGCGKSTTLRMIAGLEEISSGELIIDGKVMNDVEPKDRDIAMVFQNYALYPHMTVFDNMAFGLKLRKFQRMRLRQS